MTSLAAEATVAFDLSAPTVVVRPMLTTDRAVDLYLGDLSRRGTDTGFTARPGSPTPAHPLEDWNDNGGQVIA